jgi:hypothetical protein
LVVSALEVSDWVAELAISAPESVNSEAKSVVSRLVRAFWPASSVPE